MTSDQLLTRISAASQGDRSAFAELVGNYQGLVSATTLSITGDFQRSEDLAQETFLIAWNKLAELKEPLKFPGWLCGIARNCANNWLRRTQSDPLAQSTSLENTTEAASLMQSDPMESVAANEEAQLVWSSLAEIAPLYREPLIMFYRQGAEIAQIAVALDITEETARQRLSRGRKLLKAEVEKTVERTLTATRPDTAFTLAVLAAIPLTSAVGCSSVTKSVGLFGSGAGAAGFGAGGMTFIAILGFLVLLAFNSFSVILLSAVCLYALWIAIKRSPTPQTKRLMISAALDVNLFVFAMTRLLNCFFSLTIYIATFLYAVYCSINNFSPPELDLLRQQLLMTLIRNHAIDSPTFLLLAGLTSVPS